MFPVRLGISRQALQFFVYAAGAVDVNADELSQVLDSPNKWLKLLEYMLEPTALKGFISNNCYQQVIEPAELGYGTATRFIQRDGITVAEGQPVQLCTDNVGKWQSFHEYVHTYVFPALCCKYAAITR